MFFFSSKPKQIKKIQGDFADKIKSSLKTKLCVHCDKNLSTKITFGDGVKASCTCNNCELKAVGGSIQKLSQKNLITSQKFSNLLTSELISYQATRSEPPAQNKKNIEATQHLIKKSKETSDQIKEQFRILKEKAKQKLQQLVVESDKQNTVFIFEQARKANVEKNAVNSDLMNGMVKRSFVSTNGVHFMDEKMIEQSNASISDRLDKLRKQCKIKFKDLNSLIDDINNIQL